MKDINVYNLYTTWIIFEIQIFSGWIASSILFMLYTYFFKFMGIWKFYEEKMCLDKVWDMKNSRDILHYLKFEVDNFNLSISVICTNLILYYRYNHTDFGSKHYLLTNGIRVLIAVGVIFHFSRLNNDVCGIHWMIVWFPFLIVLLVMYSTLIIIVDGIDIH